jgi:type I restriction enzyme S subunit
VNTAHCKESLPRDWAYARLGDVCEINPRRPILERRDDTPTTFVPMAAVDETLGTISRPEIRLYAAVKKGYTWFAEGDVLFAKITPCMQNGKHAIARDLLDEIGFGTTEFHVLRPTVRVTAEWIHFFVRQPSLLRDAVSHFSGAVGQQRLPDDYLRNIEIPVPPIEEQKRIAAMLNEQIAQVDSLRERIRIGLEESRKACDSMSQKVIREELKTCLRTTLGSVLKGIETGKSVQTLERPPRAGEMAVIKVSAMSWDHFDAAEAKALPPEYNPPASHLVRKGDLLMSRANTKELVGAAVLVEKDYLDLVLSDKSLRLVVDSAKAAPEYLLSALRFPEARAFIEENATGSSSSMRNISQDLIRNIPLPLPDLPNQREVARKLHAMSVIRRALIKSFKQQLDFVSVLPAAYLRRAFSGCA